MVCDETELALLALPPDIGCLGAEPMFSTLESNAAIVLSKYQIIRFHGRAMVELSRPYPHFEHLTKGLLGEVANPLLGWIKPSHINNLYDYLIHTTPDLSWSDRFVVFGDLSGSKANVSVWDMEELEFRNDISPHDCVWRSPYPISRNDSPHAIPLIMQLAGGDESVYSDIMQSLAPLIMACKPEGVVWWVGGDADSTQLLVDTLHRTLPDQLASLDIERLDGGRQMPALNGKLGNVAYVSNGAVTDVSLYRSLAKHQTFSVHKYRSQDGTSVRGDVHHVFASPYAPSFSRRTWSTQGRTVVIPLVQVADGSGLEMTTELHGHLIAEMCAYAVRIRHQGYRYSLSAAVASIERADSSAGAKKFTVLSSPFPPTGKLIY